MVFCASTGCSDRFGHARCCKHDAGRNEAAFSGAEKNCLSCMTPDCSKAAEQLKEHPRHGDYLEAVSQSQLEKLHVILQDHLNGFSLKHSLDTFHLDPNEDLNKLDDKELARKKGQMDREFERNRKLRDDPGFVYDLEVDFEKTPLENCSWDESDEEI